MICCLSLIFHLARQQLHMIRNNEKKAVNFHTQHIRKHFCISVPIGIKGNSNHLLVCNS